MAVEYDKLETCYIMFPELYNYDIKIYKVEPLVMNKSGVGNFINYTFRTDKNLYCQFNILYHVNEIPKVYKSNAYVYNNARFEDAVMETPIVFSFDKDKMIEYYENKLNEIEDVLNEKLISLKNSINFITEQKQLLNNDIENIFQ